MSLGQFGVGLLGGLKDADQFLYRQGQMERQTAAAERDQQRLNMLKELHPGALELQQQTIEKGELENKTSQLEYDAKEYAKVGYDFHSRLSAQGDYFTDGTNGAVQDVDLDSVLTADKRGLIELMNTTIGGKFNYGVDTNGNPIQSKIANFTYDKKTGHYTVDIQPLNGANAGPLTEKRSTDNQDLVRLIPKDQFEQGLRNLLVESRVATGDDTAVQRYKDATAYERVAIEEAIKRHAVRAEVQASAAQNIDVTADNAGPVTDLMGVSQTATGEELNDLHRAVVPDGDPEATGARAVEEFRALVNESAQPGYRADGSKKSAQGYLGPVKNNVTGGTMTEVSIGVEMNGQEIEIPAMVPGLTQEEIDTLANMELEGNAANIPESIKQKAEAHARQRLAKGRSPFYMDGLEEVADELDTLRSVSEDGQVTYSDPKRARALMAQLKKQGSSEVKKLVNTEGQKQQGPHAANFVEMTADAAEGVYEWVKENPADVLMLAASGLIMMNPIGLAFRGAAITVRGAPKAIEWLTKKALLRKKKAPTTKNKRASEAEIRANQEQRRVDSTFNNRPDYSEFDIPLPHRTQRNFQAQVGTRSTGTQTSTAQSSATRSSRFMPDGMEVSPTKAGVLLAGGAYLAKEDEPSEVQKVTGVQPQFNFPSVESVRQAVVNEQSDPDVEPTRQYMQSKGITPQNFYTKLRREPTPEQLKIMFTIAKNSGKSVEDQLKLVDSMTNQLMRGNTETTALQQQQADNTTLSNQTAYINAIRQIEKQRYDQRKEQSDANKPNLADQRKAHESSKKIKGLLTDEVGNYTLLNEGEAITEITEMAGMYATAKPADKEVWGNQLTESMLTHIQAIGARGDGKFWEWSRKWENFWNNDAKLRVGTQAASSLLRAKFKVVNGKEEVVGLYFKDPGTTQKTLDYPMSMTELYEKYEGQAAEQLVTFAIVNTLKEAQEQAQAQAQGG